MGFIHKTDSKIFGIESRRESVIVWEKGEGKAKHVFLPKTYKNDVRDEIVQGLLKKAGNLYAQGNEKDARAYKNIAEQIKKTNFIDTENTSFEISKEWLKDLCQFVLTNQKKLEMTL